MLTSATFCATQAFMLSRTKLIEDDPFAQTDDIDDHAQTSAYPATALCEI